MKNKIPAVASQISIDEQIYNTIYIKGASSCHKTDAIFHVYFHF